MSTEKHAAICYGRRCIVVHNVEDNRAINQIEFDDYLGDVRLLRFLRPEDPVEDRLVLALQGEVNIKLLDAISGQLKTEFDLHTTDGAIASAFLWDTAGVSTTQRLTGVYLTKTGEIYTFSDDVGCSRVRLNKAQASSPLESILVDCDCYDSSGSAPYIAAWWLRSLLLLRVGTDRGYAEITSASEYKIVDTKTRIILSKALLAVAGWKNRVVVVLSNGSVMILEVA
jgi:hypothetical protein